MKKLVVFDIDNTLLINGKIDLLMMQFLNDNNTIFALASARNINEVKHFADLLKITYYISYNGAIITINNDLIYLKPNYNEAKNILKQYDVVNLEIITCNNQILYATGQLKTPQEFQIIDNKDYLININKNKITFSFCNKLNAITYLVNKYQIKDENVIMIGDSQNDYATLNYYKNSLIMFNHYKALDNLKNLQINTVLDYLKQPIVFSELIKVSKYDVVNGVTITKINSNNNFIVCRYKKGKYQFYDEVTYYNNQIKNIKLCDVYIIDTKINLKEFLDKLYAIYLKTKDIYYYKFIQIYVLNSKKQNINYPPFEIIYQ